MSSIRHTLITTMSIHVMATAATVVLSCIAPMVAQQMGVESSLIGTYVCCIYVAGSFAAVIGGILVRRFGGVHVSQFCLLLAALGLVLSSSGNLWIMALGAVLLGFSYGPITPASSDILAHKTPANRMGFVFSFKQTAVPLGSAITGFAIPGFVLWMNDWRAGPLLVAALCVVIVIATMYRRNQLDDHTDPSARFSLQTLLSSLRLTLTHVPLRRLLVVGSVFNAVQMCVFTFLVAFLVEDVLFSMVFAGLAMSTVGAGGIVGRVFWGVFADYIRSPKLTLILLGFLMAACCVVLTFFTNDWPEAIILVTVFVLGASAIGWNGVLLAQTAREAPAGQAGLATGSMIFFGYTVSIVMTMIFAKLHESLGYYHTGFWMIAAASSAVALWLLLAKEAKKV